MSIVNLEHLWRETFRVGLEFDEFDSVIQFNWDFSNLENAFKEGGVLYGKNVYLFGCTELDQFITFQGESQVVFIPVVVAVVSPFPPSNKIGINSVQREVEEIIPMTQMEMNWAPYILHEDRDSQVDRLNSQIFILSFTQPSSALEHLQEDRLKYKYCLPYFYTPFKEDEIEKHSEVQIIFPAEPKEIYCEFDWELDELEEFTDEVIQEEELSEDQKDAFKEFVKEKVREAKKAKREERS
ncbi:protein HEAT INTOLERANT 4-like isoform X2 [Lotus japonicus]|uniref:protein HEAT INTOLERANT 4-like isoform X2 n=1 Tax=Lotus japonicus TaxID=34305 RepID=UPI00258F5227|nr:protein HEAT INTOLERANT 4-like isoform X2 [Lotus japonicus]